MANDLDANDVSTMPQPRLIPVVVSNRARDEPGKIWGAIPVSLTDASEGYEDITYARLNYAVTRAAEWMTRHIAPRQSAPHEALAYMGPPDTRYTITTIAAMKTGFQMLFLSTRNSDEAQLSVIQQSCCTKFLCASSFETRVKKLLASHPTLMGMDCYIVPDQVELLKDEYVADFPYKVNVEEARSQPLVTIHTSSTTGMPKTVHLNQGYGLFEDLQQHVPNHLGLDVITRKPFYGSCRMFVSMPVFHAGGILMGFLKPTYHDIVSVFQPPSVPLSAEVFNNILRYGRCDGCVIPPYMLEEMLAEEKYFDTLANLKFVQFGSGPLSKAAGDKLLTRQKNCPHYIGSTECGIYLLLELDDPVADWQYFRFHPWSGVDMRPIGDDRDICELFIVKTDNAPRIPGLQPVFELFPDLDEWATRDLYQRHPSKSDHWKYMGRNDDVLVLSNGEKLNPVDSEGRIVSAHTAITGALVIGQGQFAPGLLLEVKDIDLSDPFKRFKLIDEIWPTIEATNVEAPGYGQLSKSLILFTSPEKPFMRTPKLSVRRKPTIDLYADEIQHMYSRFAESEIGEGEILSSVLPDLNSREAVEQLISGLIVDVTGSTQPPAWNDDFFGLGMDSLQALRIARKLKHELARASITRDIRPQLVYQNPTVSDLTQAVMNLVTAHNIQKGIADKFEGREEAIGKLIDQFSKSFSKPSTKQGVRRSGGNNIMLTGTTGSLGSYILVSLLQNAHVDQIFCLNRSEKAHDLQISFMTEQGAKVSNFDQRVHFLHTRGLDKPFLGLDSQSSFAALQASNVTQVIHNAWPVNFNLSLKSFLPHIAGVRALVDFCMGASDMAELIFVSSLSSMTSLATRKPVPERPIADHSAPAAMGYGESKYVSEQILSNAVASTNGAFSSTILRVGQIAGSIKKNSRPWPMQEWLPSLVISSKSIGALPTSLGRMDSVDWVPVDVLADSITELITEQNKERSQELARLEVFHVINPKSVTWADLLPAVKTKLGVKLSLPLPDWIALVQQHPADSTESNANPARKIIDFYQSLIVINNSNNRTQENGLAPRRSFETGLLASKSRAFRDLAPISTDALAGWITQWFPENNSVSPCHNRSLAKYAISRGRAVRKGTRYNS